MNTRHSGDEPRLPLPLRKRIDETCDKFEAALKAGEFPRIEDFLGDFVEPARSALILHLIQLQADYRLAAAGKTSTNGNDVVPVATSPADNNLLFGLLALQMEFIDGPTLIAAMQSWTLAKSRSLGSILLEQQQISGEQHDAIDALVTQHLKRHGDNPQRGLAVIEAINDVRDELQELRDDDIEATLIHAQRARVHDQPATTIAWSTGKPTSIERFHIQRFHDKGGIGEVYLANDSELHREVALKVLQEAYADNHDLRSRFLLEAEINGGLEHPGIVPVYALGHRDDGRPFYAMRFVRGSTLREAISRFHDANGSGGNRGARVLELRKLLSRFLDVCHAMQYAHSRGILHRDLKPANIMLGKYGETLIIDWGLAKPVDRTDKVATTAETTLRPSSDSNHAATQMGSAVGTPAYMSPEQAAGHQDEMGPASDIYCLGATLYTLLTNTPPFLDQGGDIRELLAKYRRGEATPTPPRKIKSDTSPVIQSICLKAMASRPEDRYSTPAALADDVQHWLADEPVTAHVESWPERTSRWMKRHRSWTRAGVAALILVAFVSAAAMYLINGARHRAELHKAEALRNFQHARDAVDTWFTAAAEGLGQNLVYSAGVFEFRKFLLQRAAEDYERFTAKPSSDAAVELERGRTYLRLGDMRQFLSELPEAEAAYRSATSLFHDLLHEDGDNREARLELANSRTKLGNVLALTGNHEEADQAYTSAIGELREFSESADDPARYHGVLGTSLLYRGVLLHAMKNDQEAENVLLESLGELQAAFLARPENTVYKRGLSTAQQQLSTVLLDAGRQDEAEAFCRLAIATLDGLPRQESANPHHLESRATANMILANVLRTKGQYSKELAAYREAISDYERLHETAPDVPAYQENLALARNDLGITLHKLGRAKDAEIEVNQALPIFVPLAQRYPEIPHQREMVATCRDTLGYILSDLGRISDAKSMCEQSVYEFSALVTYLPNVPGYQQRLATCYSHFAQVLHKLDEHGPAEESFRQAIRLLEDLLQRYPREAGYRETLAFVHMHFGSLQWDRGDVIESKLSFLRARDAWQQVVEMSASPESQNNFARLLVFCPDSDSRDPQTAIKLAQQALEKAPENPAYRSTCAAAYYRADEWRAAVEKIQEAMELRQGDHALDWFLLAMCQQQQGSLEEARASYERASSWMQTNCPDDAKPDAPKAGGTRVNDTAATGGG